MVSNAIWVHQAVAVRVADDAVGRADAAVVRSLGWTDLYSVNFSARGIEAQRAVERAGPDAALAVEVERHRAVDCDMPSGGM